MSLGDRSEQVDFLRDAIARIEGDGSLAPGFTDGKAARAHASLGPSLALGGLLRGGLERGALHEVVAARPGDAAAASGFALALAARFAARPERSGKARGTRKPIVWILEDAAGAETGRPYAPGLDAHGIAADGLVMVSTSSGSDSLWAMEEALKSKAVGAVVADLWRTKSYDLVASRRLVLAARKSGTPGLLVPAGAAGGARAISSAAQTRFEVRAAPSRGSSRRGSSSPGLPSLGLPLPGLPLPGPAAWSVRLARIRAGPGLDSGFDCEKFWPLVWDHEEAWFCDALPVPPLAVSRDRPAPAPASPARRLA